MARVDDRRSGAQCRRAFQRPPGADGQNSSSVSSQRNEGNQNPAPLRKKSERQGSTVDGAWKCKDLGPGIGQIFLRVNPCWFIIRGIKTSFLLLPNNLSRLFLRGKS